MLAVGVVLAGASWVALPWLTVAVAAYQCPLPVERGQIDGVAWGPRQSSGGILVTADPDTAWRIATSAANRWFPRRCLAAAQVAWGQGPGRLPLQVELLPEGPLRISGHLTGAEVAAVIADLRPPGAGWDVGLTHLTVQSQPPEVGILAHWAITGRGHANLAGFQLDIEELAADITLVSGPGGPQATISITTLRLLGGDGNALKDLLAQTGATALTRALTRAPAWIPWDGDIRLQVGSKVVEL